MTRIHCIAIGGAAMHNLALAVASKAGYRVTGSDDEIFDPALTHLRDAGLLPDELGWHPERITEDIDAIILGMHAREDNPELVRARELGLKINSFPEYLYEQTKDKIRIVAHQFFGLLGRQAFQFNEAADTVFHRGAHEHVQAGEIPEDVVGAAAHDDGVALFGDVPDNVALDLEQHVVVDVTAALAERQAARGEETGHGEQAFPFLAAFEDALGIAAFLRGLGDEFVVIHRDVQFAPDGLGDETAAAAELSSNVDDCV